MIEVWLRGALPDTPVLVQPVAHALMQAQEEVHAYTNNLPDDVLWVTPYGVASVGFHLQHLTGVIDRLFTYAQNQPLSNTQLETFKTEGVPDDSLTLKHLLNAFDNAIHNALNVLKTVDETTLKETRYVGRKKLPSTTLGLYTHAAEHTMRHVGQLLVTTKLMQQLSTRTYSIDRFDDNNLSILIASNDESDLILSRQLLPENAHPNDTLTLSQHKTTTSSTILLHCTNNQQTRNKNQATRESLPKGPAGDIKL